MRPTPALPWLDPDDAFPPVAQAWGPSDPAPGLLAGGGALDVATLRRAYGQGIFPWFSDGQPILWWSPDPRMVLATADFRLHRSLRKTLNKFVSDPRCEVRFDTAFPAVMRACATTPRAGQAGTWILPAMEQAYGRLHEAGVAHSVETWVNGALAGGLYCVAIGQAVFGESMFTRQPDASKIALSALVAFCRHHTMTMVDCQQNTRHLASLGAREMPRQVFVEQVRHNIGLPAPQWQFKPLYWSELLAREPTTP